MFKDIGEGYSVLSDEKKKRMYDEGLDIEEIDQGGARGHS
jgi:DnaJ-class molecular chaperone